MDADGRRRTNRNVENLEVSHIIVHIMHLSMLTPRVGGGGRARGGDLTFLQKKMSNATPSGENSWAIFPTPPDCISPFSPAKGLRQENYNFRKPAKSTQFLKHTQSANLLHFNFFTPKTPLCHAKWLYAFRQRS